MNKFHQWAVRLNGKNNSLKGIDKIVDEFGLTRGDNEDPAVSWVCRLTECDEAARWERLQKALKGLEAIISAIVDMSEKQ